MEAIILAGGLGTRMREETEFRPKPMVEIGGRPVLWHIMKHLATYGVTSFIIAVGYRGNMIREYFLNYEIQSSDFSLNLGDRDSLVIHGAHDESDWRVTVVETGLDSPTGERVRRAAQYASGSNVLVAYGDTLANVNVRDLIRQHHTSGASVTVTAVQPPSRFGVLEMGDADSVRGFAEKPQLEGWINIGYMILDLALARSIPAGSTLEQEPLAEVAEAGKMSAFKHRGYWQPMDTYREYVELNGLWDSGKAPWKSW
jgi:glucose-1-phosphate cytidylyltransferase